MNTYNGICPILAKLSKVLSQKLKGHFFFGGESGTLKTQSRANELARENPPCRLTLIGTRKQRLVVARIVERLNSSNVPACVARSQRPLVSPLRLLHQYEIHADCRKLHPHLSAPNISLGLYIPLDSLLPHLTATQKEGTCRLKTSWDELLSKLKVA